jgi:Plant transposon protein
LQNISTPIGEEKKKFAVWQEAAQKDIKHAFSVFQRKFQIMKKPIKQWYVEDTCLTLHNWMVTDHVSWNEEEHGDLYDAVDLEAACNQPDKDLMPNWMLCMLTMLILKDWSTVSMLLSTKKRQQ